MRLRDSAFTIEDVFKRRYVCSRGVTTLLRLFELLWIANQNKALRGLRSSEDICQRHLPCFIDKENIDRFKQLLPRPQPVRPAYNICCSILECAVDGVVICNLNDLRVVAKRFVAYLLHTTNISVLFTSSLHNFVQQLSYYSMTRRRDTDPLARLDKVTNHTRASVCVTCAGWALYRENSVVEGQAHAAIGGNNGLTWLRGKRFVGSRRTS